MLLLAIFNYRLINVSIGAIRNDGLGYHAADCQNQHFTGIVDHYWHRSFNYNVAKHMQVSSAFVKILQWQATVIQRTMPQWIG